MIFGIKEVRNDLGEFSSDKCSACKNSETYHFYKITRFLVVFFLNLIPLGSHYEAVCTGCQDTLAVDNQTGIKIARENFNKRRLAIAAKTAFKLLAAAVVIAAAVVLPLTVRFPLDARPETLKGLIAETEDGYYGIQDRNGNVLGIVEVAGGDKILTYYDDVSVLVKEPGADGSFKMHEYRQEATNDTQQDDVFLVRIPDNPGVLEDRYGIPVRVYHYDSEKDALGYSMGVNDLTAITYTADKVTYPFHYYSNDSNDPTEYVWVLYLSGNRHMTAVFIPELPTGETNVFAALSVKDLSGGRTVTATQYNFNNSMIVKAGEAGLSHLSSAQDILDFLDQNKPLPTSVTDYQYYEGTKVVSSMTYSMPDANGNMQSVTQPFSVTEKNGYYIVKTEGTAE